MLFPHWNGIRTEFASLSRELQREAAGRGAQRVACPRRSLSPIGLRWFPVSHPPATGLLRLCARALTASQALGEAGWGGCSASSRHGRVELSNLTGIIGQRDGVGGGGYLQARSNLKLMSSALSHILRATRSCGSLKEAGVSCKGCLLTPTQTKKAQSGTPANHRVLQGPSAEGISQVRLSRCCRLNLGVGHFCRDWPLLKVWGMQKDDPATIVLHVPLPSKS